MSELLDLRSVNATWHLGPCAEVRVGEHVTRYVRRGSGPSVVLLGADAEANPMWEVVVGSLAGNHRLVIPQPPPDDADASSWLRGFVEGLGVSSCVLVAGGSLTDAALELATADDLTVRKLVLLGASATPSNRVLVIKPDLAPDDAKSLVREFLSAA